MFTERLRQDWQHTSKLITALLEVNRTKKGKPIDPNTHNPMEQEGQKKGKRESVSLNTPQGFAQLAKVAQWRPR